jgi:hypothetical protein
MSFCYLKVHRLLSRSQSSLLDRAYGNFGVSQTGYIGDLKWLHAQQRNEDCQ